MTSATDTDAKAPSVAVESLEPAPAVRQPRTILAFPEPREARERRIRRERLKLPRQRLETKIMAALEKLEDLRQEFVARLDALHGDPDLEPGCDDDVNIGSGSGSKVNGAWIDDMELDDSDWEPGHDEELDERDLPPPEFDDPNDQTRPRLRY